MNIACSYQDALPVELAVLDGEEDMLMNEDNGQEMGNTLASDDWSVLMPKGPEASYRCVPDVRQALPD